MTKETTSPPTLSAAIRASVAPTTIGQGPLPAFMFTVPHPFTERFTKQNLSDILAEAVRIVGAIDSGGVSNGDVSNTSSAASYQGTPPANQ